MTEMLKLFLFFLLLLCPALDAHAEQDTPDICKEFVQNDDQAGGPAGSRASIPHGTGLLWKIEGSDGRQSHLFGTIHSQDRLVTNLPPPVRLALAQSRQLVMEIVPDSKANQAFSASIYFTDGATLDSLIDKEIYHALVQKLPSYGIDAEHARHLKPWAAFTLIGRPRPVRAATQDEVLMRAATDTGQRIAGLESMEELVSTLDGIPRSDQITILYDTVCNHERILHNTRDLVKLYVARDLAGMVNFNEQPHQDEAVFGRYMQRIVYDRNRRMVTRMEKYLREGGAFVTIGALHLPGAKGVLRLLEEKGYRIVLVY